MIVVSVCTLGDGIAATSASIKVAIRAYVTTVVLAASTQAAPFIACGSKEMRVMQAGIDDDDLGNDLAGANFRV